MASSEEIWHLNSKDHKKYLANGVIELSNKGEFTDAVLVTGCHEFHVHRLVLSALSPYFRKIFNSIPVNEPAYVPMSTSKQTMTYLIEYMYNGTVAVEEKLLNDIFENIRLFQLDGVNNFSSVDDVIDEQQPNDLARNVSGPSRAAIQYQATHINRFLVSSGVYEQTTTFASTRQPQYACENSTNYDDFYTATSNEMDESAGQYGSMDQTFEHQNAEWDAYNYDNTATESDAPKAKRLKRKDDLYDFIEPADIRTVNGRENLFYENGKFYKFQKPNKKNIQRWNCVKHNHLVMCRSAMATIEINGTMMIKVLNGEHSHQ